jgi:hypothetical protein
VGNDDFMVFDVLEVTFGTKVERLLIEEKYLGQHFDHAQRCYNLTVRAVSSDGCTRQNKEEMKEKMSWKLKRAWKAGAFANSMASRSKEYSLLSPDNVLYTGSNISKLCREQGLSFRHISALILGAQRSHKGWRRSNDLEYTPPNSTPHPTLLSPEGFSYTTTNIEQFARDHNLIASNLYAMLHGKLKTHKGWSLEGATVTRPQSQRKSYTFLSPVGIVHEGVRNLTEFAEQQELCLSSLSKLVSGKRKTLHGWMLLDKVSLVIDTES